MFQGISHCRLCSRVFCIGVQGKIVGIRVFIVGRVCIFGVQVFIGGVKVMYLWRFGVHRWFSGYVVRRLMQSVYGVGAYEVRHEYHHIRSMRCPVAGMYFTFTHKETV